MKSKTATSRTTVRHTVWKKTGGCCAYCGKAVALKGYQIDHVIPLLRGIADKHVGPQGRGTDTIENMLPACARCNRWKSTFSIEEFRSEIEAQHRRLQRDSAAFRMAEDFMLLERVNERVVFYFEKLGITAGKKDVKKQPSPFRRPL